HPGACPARGTRVPGRGAGRPVIRQGEAGVTGIVIERLRTIVAEIQGPNLTAPLNGLRRWHVDLDLKHVPREIVEKTSDLLRQAVAHLDLPPHRPGVALKAVEEALALWQPTGSSAEVATPGVGEADASRP